MKNFLAASFILASATATASAQPAVRFVAGDSSAHTAICVSAQESFDAAKTTAQELGVNRYELVDLLCNGIPVARFAKPVAVSAEMSPLMVKTSDRSPESQLCAAAISSPAMFSRLKEKYFAGESDLELNIECNGLTLRSFKEKYSSRALTASR